MFYTLFYFLVLICRMKGALLNTYCLITKTQSVCIWFWTDIELMNKTGICSTSEGLKHNSIWLKECLLFKFYFACQIKNFASFLSLLSFMKNFRMHLEIECVHPECEYFVAGVFSAACLKMGHLNNYWRDFLQKVLT